METIITWFMAHQVVMGAAVIGALDFVFAIVPSWESNGILHFIYVQAKKLVGGA